MNNLESLRQPVGSVRKAGIRTHNISCRNFTVAGILLAFRSITFDLNLIICWENCFLKIMRARVIGSHENDETSSRALKDVEGGKFLSINASVTFHQSIFLNHF